jgi:hypothetical protein
MTWRSGWRLRGRSCRGGRWSVSGRITEAQVQKLLGFATRDELDGFLKAHEVWLGYSVDDLERDRAALRRLGF